MSSLHLSTGILDHSSFANCSRSFRFEGCLLPTAVLRSLHRCSMGFRSGLIAGHFRTLQRFVCNHFWVLFEVCFGSLSCWKYVLPEGLWFCHISFGKLQSCFFMPLCQQWCPPGSPTIASLLIQMATDSASWHCCTLCLQISLNLFGS